MSDETKQALYDAVFDVVKDVMRSRKDAKANASNKKRPANEEPAAASNAKPSAPKKAATKKPAAADEEAEDDGPVECVGRIDEEKRCPIAVADRKKAESRTIIDKKMYDLCKVCKNGYTKAMKAQRAAEKAAAEAAAGGDAKEEQD